jgi:hypothetical protein
VSRGVHVLVQGDADARHGVDEAHPAIADDENWPGRGAKPDAARGEQGWQGGQPGVAQGQPRQFTSAAGDLNPHFALQAPFLDFGLQKGRTVIGEKIPIPVPTQTHLGLEVGAVNFFGEELEIEGVEIDAVHRGPGKARIGQAMGADEGLGQEAVRPVQDIFLFGAGFHGVVFLCSLPGAPRKAVLCGQRREIASICCAGKKKGSGAPPRLTRLFIIPC